MSIIKDTFFGGAEKKAAKKQERALVDAQNITRESTDAARQDLLNAFPQAQQTAQEGFQGALDVFGQSLPAQTDVFTQGNLGAQQAILSGLPQMQNALLGNNIDLRQLQPFEIQQPDLGFFQQQLPQTVAREQAAQDAAIQERERAIQEQTDRDQFFNRTRGQNQFGPRNQSRFLGGSFQNPFGNNLLTRQNFK